MMKWGKCISLLGMLFVLSLTCCAKQTGTEASDTVPENIQIQHVDWAQGFKVGAVTEGGEYHLCDYTDMMSVPEDDRSTQSDIVYIGKGQSSDFYMTYPKLSEEDSEELPEHIYIVTTDEQGNKVKETDIYFELDALGEICRPVGLWVDDAGRFFTLRIESYILSVYAFDNNGKGICSFDKMSREDIICRPVQDNTGRLFLPVIDKSKKNTRLLYLNNENQWSELAIIEGETIEHWYAMYENVMYYGDSGKLIRWDVFTGKRESVLSLTENGLSSPENISISFGDDGEVYLRYNGIINADYMVRLASGEMKEEILTVGATWQYDTAPAAIREAEFFARNNGVRSEVMQEPSRLLIDMVNGKGPDILLVSHEELVELQENEALLDLREVISEEQIQAFIPQAIDAGTVDGVFCGLPEGFSLNTMFVRGDTWDKDGWTLDDALAMQRSLRDKSVFETDAQNMVIDWLSIGIVRDLEQRKSRFVDWENGVSRFEEEGFHKYLEEIKQLGENIEREQSNFCGDLTQVMEKEIFAVEKGDGPYGYVSLMNHYSGELKALGYPAEDRKGNYLTARSLLVVNARVSEEKKELIRGYIEHLLSPRVQLELSMDNVSIIDGFFCDHVFFDEDAESYYWEYQGLRSDLYVKKLYVEDFEKILESATVTIGDRNIINILGEELGPYLSGDRSALDVTRKIDNRVQLYLDENY